MIFRYKIFCMSLLFLSLSACSLVKPPLSNTSSTRSNDIHVQKRIFVLWDSLSAWYQLAYEDSYPAQLEQLLQNQWYAIKVINGGESGDTSAWLKARIDRITTDAQSGDIALVVIWWNDGLQWLSTQDLENNIKNIIIWLQSRGLKTIVWWMQLPTNLGKSYRLSFADVYPTVARDTNSVLIPFILSWVAGIPTLNLRDGIHPNSTGQSIVAQTVYDVVVKILTTKN